jgi:ABC-type Zn uptake system ZnuABC Zn-binding protein ZnuA
VVLINGAGLEDFMDDALESLDAPIIDASAGIDLLPYTGHEHHDFDDDEEDEDDHFDPHIWMDPSRAAQMTQNIAAGLSETQSVVPGAVLTENAEAYAAELTALAEKWAAQYETMDSSERNLITFHDGFAYLADAFDLTILKSIEEESGSEASAKDLAEIVSLVRSYDLPMIFVENNGSDSSAKAIARETGVAIGSLSMLMSDGGQSYEEAIEGNLATIYDGLHKGETERA